MTGKLPRLFLLLLVALGALLAAPDPALAHAATVGSTPAPGSVVGASPTEITVMFSESITPVSGRVQVIAPDGERISGLAVARGAVLHIPVRAAKRPLGTYLISFRVISADSHPVGGAITFSVGAPSARPEAATTTGTHPSVRIAVPTFKFLGYAGITLAVGPAMFLALLWPRRRSRTGAIRLVRIGLGLTAVATLGALGTQAQQGSGAALWQVSAVELGEVARSQFGLTLLARLGVLLLLAVLLPAVVKGAAGRSQGAAVILLGFAGLATWPLTGHAIAAPLPAVTVTVGVVHLAAMAIWLGGLVTLAGFLLRGTDRRVLGVILPVWSRWAALSVIWLAMAGTVQAVVQVGTPAALVQTGYGRLLLAKLGVLVLVLAAAAGARRFVRTSNAGNGLRRTVGIEVLATVVILAMSAVLVQVDPGRTAGAKDGAVTGVGVSETLTCPLYTLQFNIYPVELGEYNTVHAFLYTPEGKPLPPAEWEVSTQLVGQGLEAVKEPLLGLNPPHHALGSIAFPLPGTYEVAFTIRVDDLNRATVKTTVTVPPTS
ncbi:copper resistance CopC/CopD family protein [Actinoplanes awajinensis]|uniref:Copper resistance protein CopC n=1 Tax=Actinoplanes awajinensis subsp. mycoplanecinus TaxID=135947 RepID=A0A124G8Y4_9ACTN|nr:copper resistance protein CopC [Actinoplanes awajinensis]KUL27430.1 copper resistance protein CopC [Actinoplanes awajinensis subsp. mycoplanecinus]